MQEKITPASTAAHIARIEEQVKGAAEDNHNLRKEFIAFRQEMATSIADLGKTVSGAIDGLNRRFNERATVRWTPIFTGLGVAITFAGLLGAALYSPITSGMADLKISQKEIRTSIVPRVELQQRWAMELRESQRNESAIVEQRRDLRALQSQVDKMTGMLGTLAHK